MAETTVPYELISTLEWAKSVKETFQFQARGDDGGDDGNKAWDYTGMCPRCHHQVAYPLEMGGENIYRSEGANRKGGMVVRCNCGSEHSGRPEGSKGCGAYATLEFEWR